MHHRQHKDVGWSGVVKDGAGWGGRQMHPSSYKGQWVMAGGKHGAGCADGGVWILFIGKTHLFIA